MESSYNSQPSFLKNKICFDSIKLILLLCKLKFYYHIMIYSLTDICKKNFIPI